MELFTKKIFNYKGFTLIELIVVIAIIGTLATILLPKFTGFTDKARGTIALSEAKQIAFAMDTIKIETGIYPTAKSTIYLRAFGKSTVTADRTFSVNPNATTGIFTWQVTFGTIKYKAGRTTGAAPIKRM